MAKPLKFGLVRDMTRGDCFPLEALLFLKKSGQLKNTEEWWAKSSGDCHNVTAALMDDLKQSGIGGQWDWVVGRMPDGNDHSWIECDGWTIDASNGSAERPILVMPVSLYRARHRDIALASEQWSRVRGNDAP